MSRTGRCARWRRRAVTVAGMTTLLALTPVGIAWASDGKKLGQTPGALSWITLKDSRGISVWHYEMSLDRGGITSPGKFYWSMMIDGYWQFYRAVVVIAAWLVDWVLSFGWLPALATPALSLSQSLTTMVGRFGLTPALLTVAALVTVIWMATGRWALGIFELFTSLVIASLATGVLAYPVQTVAGGHGLIIQSRDVGLEVAAGLANNGDTSAGAEGLRHQTSATLVDTFVRLPHQMINFGTAVDGGKCEKTYDDVVRRGPYGDGSEIRDAVGECDSALGDVAGNPGPGQALSAVVLTPAAGLALLFAVVLAGAVLLAAAYALYQSLKVILTLVTGVLPGLGRGALLQTLADLVISLVTLVFSLVFLTAYLLLIQDVFKASQPGDGVMVTFFFIDILLVVGVVLFWRGRGALRRSADRLAQALASRPGSRTTPGPTSLPERSTWRRDAARTGKAVIALGAWRMLSRGGYGAPEPPEAGGQQALASSVSTATAIAASRAPVRGRGSAAGPSGARLTRRLRAGRLSQAAGGKLVRLGTRATLAIASGGGSALGAGAMAAAGHAGPGTLTAVRTARRAAMVGKLAAARHGPRAASSSPAHAAAVRRQAQRTQAAAAAPAAVRRQPTVRSTAAASTRAAATPASGKSSARLRATMQARSPSPRRVAAAPKPPRGTR